MTVDRELERAVRNWISAGPEQLPDATLDLALQEIAVTPQRGASQPVQAFPMLRSSMMVAAAAVVIAVAAILAMTWLPGNNVGPTGPQPTPSATPTPTPTPTPTARATPPSEVTGVSGQFEGVFGSVVIEASGSGSSVSGSMNVTVSRRQYTVDLRCSRSEPDGVLLLGGPVRESTHREVSVGDRVAIALRSGDPQTSIFWFEGRRRPGNCAAFLERIPNVASFLEPIEGSFEFSSSAADG